MTTANHTIIYSILKTNGGRVALCHLHSIVGSGHQSQTAKPERLAPKTVAFMLYFSRVAVGRVSFVSKCEVTAIAVTG